MNDSRGQLLLVAAVLIALVIVASAVLLNGLVTPETATTSSLSTDAHDLDRGLTPIRGDLEGMFEVTTSVDRDDESLPYAEEADLRDDAATFRTLVLQETANRRGAILDVSYNPSASISGHVVQQRTVGEFTDQGGSADWQLGTGISAVPRARFNVTDQDVFAVGSDETAVVVRGTGSQRWTLNVSRGRVFVEGEGVTGTRRLCDATDPPGVYPGDEVIVDVRMARQNNATVEIHDGDDVIACKPFRFGGDVTGDWDLEIHNGDGAEGTYVVTFDGTATVVPGGTTPDHVGDDLVINPGFDVRYVTEGIEYESTFALYNATR